MASPAPARTIGKASANDQSVRFLQEDLQEFLDRDGVTEVVVNRPGEVWTEVQGAWVRYDAPKVDFQLLRAYGNAVAVFSNNAWDDRRPILSAVLPDGERSQFVMPAACEPKTISLTIRKPSFQMRTLDTYEESGFFAHVRPIVDGPGEIERQLVELHSGGQYGAFLRAAVKAGLNIIIAGETGSGKTTLMKALMQEIPTHERLITIEDVPELFLPNHPNHVHLFYPSEGGEGANVTPAGLLRSCLRMKPDRILLAELRGGETLDFVNVCASGHGGSITSLHAGSAALSFERLALMVMQNPKGQLPYDVIRRLLYMVVDVVVHVTDDATHGRHITEIWYEPSIKRQR